MLALATTYVIVARLGLLIDAIAGFATLVWPPTGIALAALVCFGYRLWPAIFIGAFVVNLWTGAPALVALGIAVGNTLEAVVGAYALRRIRGFRPSLDRLQDVLGVIVLAAVLSTTISAPIGVASLSLAHMVSPSQSWVAWRAWWLGDLIGDLVVAPLLLVWITSGRRPVPANQIIEGAALLTALVCANTLIFGGFGVRGTTALEQAYLVFPLLVWAALRFEQRGATLAAFVTAVIAVWGTVVGHGPFVRTAISESLFALQTFIGVGTATFLVLGASIAERRRAEERLRRAHEAAAEANRVKSDFLGVMSHELRTPLNAISGYVDLLSTGLAGPMTDKQEEFLTRIQTNQRHLLSLIEDVLGFAKVEAGRLTIEIGPVPVCEAIAALEPMVGPDLRRKRLTFTSEPADPSLVARADPEKLRQILLNLVTNAVKFTADGGRITVAADRADGAVRIRISDTGIGIPPEQLPQIFDPFFQVDRGTTRRYPGIGLGLAIARDLARAMGGDVKLESTQGEGSTALLLLPSA